MGKLDGRMLFFRVLKDYPHGNEDDLIGALVDNGKGLSPEAAKSVCEEMGLIGVIQHGYDGANRKRYKTTKFGESYGNSFRRFPETKQRIVNLVKKLNID